MKQAFQNESATSTRGHRGCIPQIPGPKLCMGCTSDFLLCGPEIKENKPDPTEMQANVFWNTERG